MRSFKLTLSSLALLLAFCAPAPAQGASEAQYTSEFCPTGPSGPNTMQVQSVCDVPPAAADNVGQGTSAVNEALTEPTSSSKSSASASSATSSASTSSASTSSASTSSASTSAGSALAGDDAEAGTATGSSGTNGPETDSPETNGPETNGPETNGPETDRSSDVAAGGPEAAGVASEEGLASITELPETGGPPPAALISGVLLVTLGLTVRRLVP